MHLLYIIGMTLTWILIAAMVIHVVMDNRQPAKTMAWALVILFIPVVGVVFYLFFGVNHRRERLISKRSVDELSKRSIAGPLHTACVAKARTLLAPLSINT